VSAAHCSGPSLPSNPLHNIAQELEIAFSRDTESLIQIFDAIRDWTLLRYHVRKSSEHRKGARAREKMESPKPSHRATGEAAENLKGHE
jgi:hypothetical protein